MRSIGFFGPSINRQYSRIGENLEYSDDHVAPIFDIPNDIVLEIALFLRT